MPVKKKVDAAAHQKETAAHNNMNISDRNRLRWKDKTKTAIRRLITITTRRGMIRISILSAYLYIQYRCHIGKFLFLS